ncbi:hypothetical protein L1887_62528 [Cichorium endivia]|nr:hypothetical protein L1887_62528 [Cichorium endivia]
MLKVRSRRHVRIERMRVAVVGRAREVRHLRRRRERVGRRADASHGAFRTVEAGHRAASHAARQDEARSARQVKSIRARVGRSARRHRRRAVRRCRVLPVRHGVAVRVTTASTIILDLDAGEVVVLKSLRECGACVRRKRTARDRERVAEDARCAAGAHVCAFGVGMVAARVLGECSLAAEGLSTALY